MAEDELVRFRDPEIAALATCMAARLPELADRLAERILKPSTPTAPVRRFHPTTCAPRSATIHPARAAAIGTSQRAPRSPSRE